MTLDVAIRLLIDDLENAHWGETQAPSGLDLT